MFLTRAMTLTCYSEVEKVKAEVEKLRNTPEKVREKKIPSGEELQERYRRRGQARQSIRGITAEGR